MRRHLPAYWKYIPVLLATLVTTLALVVSCKPGIRITPTSREHRELAVARPVSEIAFPPKPKSYRSENDLRYRYHRSGWLDEHMKSGKKKPDECLLCHVPESCVVCHESQMPDSHRSSKWVISHARTAPVNASNCADCHTEQFCSACHRNAKPGTHTSVWLKLHGKQVLRQSSSCRICHEDTYCSDCHGLTMPHPGGWHASHASASRDMQLCSRCHQTRECQLCHQKTSPRSHTANWQKEHGKIVVEEKRDCSTCHAGSYCLDCHGGIAMPHPSGFLLKHKDAGASLAQGSPCYKCHEQKYCQICHPGR